MTRARRAASARPRPDRTRASSSVRWSAVSISNVDGMRHHMIYNSLVQATSRWPSLARLEIARQPRPPARLRLPPPEQPEALSMPSNERIGLHHREEGAPVDYL